LDSVGISQPVVFVGLSMGGYVGWQFVRKYAERLRALVMCHTRVVADTPAAAAGRHNLAAQVLKESSSRAVEEAMMPRLLPPGAAKDVVSDVERMARTASPQGLAANLRGMALRPDATPLLPAIRVPALAIGGELDAISTPEEMRGWAAQIPGCRIETLPGVGHLSPLEAPAAFNQCLSEFLRGVLGR
jgi:pimeloyl-ACP methyl ester carboxylesterase